MQQWWMLNKLLEMYDNLTDVTILGKQSLDKSSKQTNGIKPTSYENIKSKLNIDALIWKRKHGFQNVFYKKKYIDKWKAFVFSTL